MARTSGLATIPVAKIQREIERRQAKANDMARERNRLLRRVQAIEAQLAARGRASNGHASRGVRARNEQSLPDMLAAVLKSKTMSIADAMAAVRKAGYKTNAANFRMSVSIALGDKGRFKRVERGVYTAK